MTVTEMEVKLIDVMGSDLSVVNAARVSFQRESGFELDESGEMGLPNGDKRLIAYLANYNHFTPFCHAFASFRIKAPIFVARQLVKHQVGLAWNEVSRRYVNTPPEFFLPRSWRKAAENVKQGSSSEEATSFNKKDAEVMSKACLGMYNSMIDQGVCAEQARMILPQNMMTEWVWSGSLMAFARVCKLRLDPHTQLETQEVARHINSLMSTEFPVSWKALNETTN
jgi:thymidylate synthase (FAD)